jgi:hypothetical protein
VALAVTVASMIDFNSLAGTKPTETAAQKEVPAPKFASVMTGPTIKFQYW